MQAAESALPPIRHVFRGAVSVLLICGLLTGCATDGNSGGMGQKESVGTGAGALIGGLAGAFLGRSAGGKVAAALVGAAVGGFIGNRIGAMLDDEDQKALQAQAKQALLTQPDNNQVTWASDRSGATATVVPENTRVETRQVRVVRDANVAPPPQLDLIGGKYVTKGAANVRLSPAADAPVATTLPSGTTIWAVGKVHDRPWIMVAKGGKSIGYVNAISLTPAPKPAVSATAPVKPAPATSTAQAQPAAAPFDLDAAAPVRTPADLDALAPTEKADVVVASVTCRDIKTTATAKGETAVSTQTACKSPDGAWELN